MGRTAQTKPTGKGERPNERKQLNVLLPRQLLFDFNAAARKHATLRRDALVEELLRGYLEMVEPTAKSLRDPAGTAASAAASAERVKEREALRLVREHAIDILDVTSAFATRKPPQRVERTAARKRRAS